jgi:tripeptide aminopeptidase
LIHRTHEDFSMAVSDGLVDTKAAIALLMRFLAVEGITGRERAIGREVVAALIEAGVPRKAIHFDKANESIPLPTETGNLIVTLPGSRPGDRLLFSTHLDTVPLCAGAVPVRNSDRITPKGETALGGDNRTGCAALVTLVNTLLKHKLPHPPLTLLFTVREESGLFGARYLDPKDLSGPVMGFNIDGRNAAEFCIGAVGAERWEVEITGKASHAGVSPEKGISASMIAALALAEVHAGGWFGKVKKDTRAGTSNIGSISGRNGRSAGDATNVVTDYVHVTGEARSHDARFFKEITKVYANAFQDAASKVTDDTGHKAKVRFHSRLDYYPFRLKPAAAVVRRAEDAARSVGLTPSLRIGNGGLDANWLVRHKIPTVTFGAGQNNIHTTDEFVDLNLFADGCRMAVALATIGG